MTIRNKKPHAKKTSRLPLKDRLSRSAISLLLLLGILALLPYYIPSARLPGDRTALAGPEGGFWSANGVDLYYRSWGEQDAPGGAVLLVHGLGGSTYSWRHTAPALAAEGCRVVAVDLPGFGWSDRRPGLDHTPEGRAALLWALLDQADPGQKWHLVGHSMGGAAVAAMALQNPLRVESITLAAGALYPHRSAFARAAMALPPVHQWVKVLAPRLFLGRAKVSQMLTRAYGRPPLEEEIDAYHLPFTVAGSDTVLADLFASPSSLTGPALLAGLDIPVLLLWGENDSVVPLEQGERLAADIPGATLSVIPGHGHCPMETAHAQFSDLLLVFFRSIRQ